MSLKGSDIKSFSATCLKWWWRSSLVALCICGLWLLIFVSRAWPTAYPLKAERNSTLIYDRSGCLLREVHLKGGTSKRWIPLKDIPTWVQDAVLTAEDRRFYYHCGADPLAIMRSAYYNCKVGRVIMGGSTISEQLIRLLMPARPRTLKNKFIELLYSLRLSFNFSKEQILEAYLNRVYFGGQAYGLEAAAQLYFGCPARALSPAQGAFLTVLVRSPQELAPYKDINPALKLQRDLLLSMEKRGILGSADLKRALAEKITLAPLSERFAAPHFCDFVVAQNEQWPAQDAVRIDTTLDLKIQDYAENILNYHLERLASHNVKNGSLVVLDIKRGDILAMVGSKNYFSLPDGQNNGSLTLRQPGSALKPFTYALALQHGFTAASILPDLSYLGAMLKDAFVPENYDRQFHGPVRLRQALACSYNVPAVYVLQKIGINSLLELLHNLGFTELNKNAQHYGLGLTLGSGEVNLLHLANAYRGLASGGKYQAVRFCQAYTDSRGEKRFWPLANTEQKVISPEVCTLIGDILADSRARSEAFGYHSALNLPFRCSVKTGTSKDYRDNWCIGYDDNYVVGVWTGNFDASAMHNISGITGAAPIFRDVMKYVHQYRSRSSKILNIGKFNETEPGLEKRWICAESGAAPGPYCYNKIQEYFLFNTFPHEVCQVHKLYCFSKTNKQPVNPLSCSPYEYFTKVVPVYPPLYRAWMREHKMLIPPQWTLYRKIDSRAQKKHAQSSRLSMQDESEPPEDKIIFPEDGAVFRIDPFLKRQHQNVNLRATSSAPNKKLTWKIDGKIFQVSSEPHVVSWPLREGVHRITLQTEDSKSSVDSITVTVYP
mgnify:FL=1